MSVADHKNLEYQCTAKRLKSYQAKWALLLFQLTFTSIIDQGGRLESQTLSRVFQWGEEKNFPLLILPTSFVVGAITWSIDEHEDLSAVTPSYTVATTVTQIVRLSTCGLLLYGESCRLAPCFMDFLESWKLLLLWDSGSSGLYEFTHHSTCARWSWSGEGFVWPLKNKYLCLSKW